MTIKYALLLVSAIILAATISFMSGYSLDKQVAIPMAAPSFGAVSDIAVPAGCGRLKMLYDGDKSLVYLSCVSADTAVGDHYLLVMPIVPVQKTTGDNSPSINGVTGNVTITNGEPK